MSTKATTSGVSLRHMVKRYGNVTAVDGIDLEIASGEFLVLLGPSGCGKTTTLRCIAGLEEISGGEIHIGGELVSTADQSVPPEKREIGMVFQSYAIWPHMTVRQNVEFGLRLKKLPAAEIKARVGEALSVVGLEPYAERSASALSGGQQQRVALARAIVLRPRILLFDEPLSNLDAKLREHMRFEIRQLQKRLGITAIYVTHDQQEAMVVADRIVLMNGGRIEQIASPREIYDRPASLFAAGFIGLANVVDGIARESDGGTAITLPGGAILSSRQAGVPSVRPVKALFRPEHVALSSELATAENAFAVTIDEVVFLGNIADYTFDLFGTKVRCQLSPPGSWREGETVCASIPAEHVILLAGEK